MFVPLLESTHHHATIFNTTPSNSIAMDPPRNRKQRRAAATASQADFFDPASIPLARPPKSDSSKKDGKTLVDLIQDRQKELGITLDSPGSVKSMETKYVTIDPKTGEMTPLDDSHASTTDNARVEEIASDDEDEETDEPDPISPLIDTVLLSIPLTVLHLTLGYLAAHQYAQEINLDFLVRNSCLIAFPVLTLLIHLSHGHIISFRKKQSDDQVISLFPWHPEKASLSFLRKLLFPPSPKTMVFLPAAVLLGNKLMAMTNEETYYAVMKQAPAIGTLWVWCILELPLGATVLGALGPLLWGVYGKGYGII
ncbi:uncharacterized protein BDV14DRAFT_196684 [Aspergillus stella-maris]|uniref:uncharacterized protein n=1 Tax=Aspergillus stella-maris TaxID=1810926 RepID=UPI003CCCDB2B